MPDKKHRLTLTTKELQAMTWAVEELNKRVTQGIDAYDSQMQYAFSAVGKIGRVLYKAN